MKNSTGNRALQKFILVLSLTVICIGVYLIIAIGFSNFFTLGMRTSQPPSTRHQPFFFLFIIALVMGFFSARNLLKGK
ncbi:MAG TPA: hypothetical protein VE978_25475 [Chitinophagales bacterium]|nr:hypothetical protein [Chitinophagales bacterium]